MNVARKALPLVLLVCCGLLACGYSLPAAHAQIRIEAEAYGGVPFGVGRVTIHSGGEFRLQRVPRPGGGRIAELARRLADQAGKGDSTQLQSAELALVEKSGRTFYPVFEKRDRPILKQFVSVPTESSVLFLFQGEAPLDLTVYAPQATPGQITPRTDAAAHARLLQSWWRDYSSANDGRDAAREYPQMVEEYLTDTLARRMQLALPRRQPKRDLNLLRAELNLLFETETARLELAEAVLMGDLSNEIATEILPEELPAPKPEALNDLPQVPVEPLALRVPVECLYVRFGNFPNFLWLRHRLEDWGGELRDVFSERGLDFGYNQRLQQQMGLREGKLAELLGDKVIADVALIGTDVSMREGAAMGTVFQAKSNTALTADLTQQRNTAMRETKGARLEKLTIAGRNVSYISSPDGAIRSYYVVDGDFHLVTTSRTIVEWFLATADGKHESIGQSAAFRYTRRANPLDRNDTVFVYLSPEFFANLLSGSYQIELNRRLRSAVEMELVPIAQLAARSENKPSGTIEELIAADMLPTNFGRRADGSQLTLVDGVLVDSLRGARGTFVPAPDMKIEKITPAEAAQYRQLQDSYAENWGPMDPLVVAIRRQELEGGKLERVVLDAQAAPLSAQHIQSLSNWLGDPTDQRLAPVQGNVVSFDAVLRGGSFFSGPEHRLFGGLRNADPSLAQDPLMSLINRVMNSPLEGLQGYIGAWPNSGYLRLIGGDSNLPPDANGYTRLRTGMWRRQFNNYTLLSFHPEILEQVSPQLKLIKADRPAQIWLRAEDLANSTLAPMINAYGYKQLRQISAGNTRFMNLLSEQLHVPPAEAMATAERLLSAKFVAPLGGTYELRKWDGGLQNWVATALVDNPGDTPPTDYQFPALTWLRGAEIELLMQAGPQPGLSVHGEFIMPVEVRAAPTLQLPSLPFGKPKPGATPPATRPADPKAPAPKSTPPGAKPNTPAPLVPGLPKLSLPQPAPAAPAAPPKRSGRRVF